MGLNSIVIKQQTKKVKGQVFLPGSKSISNRALIIGELSGCINLIQGLSKAEDTKLLDRHLRFIRTCGASGIPTILDVNNAGTVARFLATFLVSHVGTWLLTGSSRMQERPIGILVEVLRQLGAQIEYRNKVGSLPLLITGTDIHGGEITVDTSVSSQFVTAILLIGPYLEEGLTVHLEGDLVSESYIEMTIRMMRDFGAEVVQQDNIIHVNPVPYQAREYSVEVDWSSAAYWYQMVALSDEADLLVKGLHKGSIQGDHVLVDIYQQLGVKTVFETDGVRLTKTNVLPNEVTFDFKNCPDTAVSVISTCAALRISGKYTGVGHLKYKESDRLKSLRIELEKIGAVLDIKGAGCSLSFSNDKILPSILSFDTYGDHRMAMSFAPLAMVFPHVVIQDHEVVKKSYPDFWTEMKSLGMADFAEMETN